MKASRAKFQDPEKIQDSTTKHPGLWSLQLEASLDLGRWILVLLCSFVLRDSVMCQEILGEAQETIIHYGATEGLADPVTLLKNRLAKGAANLRFEPERGYLKSLLKELRVPVSSQVLVFSKTSSQHDQTSPQTPRAIYFSDNVSVGWVPGGAVIDVAAVDPSRGPIFYTLAQNLSEQEASVADALVSLNGTARSQEGSGRTALGESQAAEVAGAAQTAPGDWPQQRIALAGERLLEYMLFRDEAQLKGPVKGAFAAEFPLAGPHDSKGRSLRQLDLNTHPQLCGSGRK